MIPLFKVFMSPRVPKQVEEVLMSGYIGQGEVVEQFEKYLKEWFNNDFVLTLNSATSAEHLALHMLKNPDENMIGHHGVVFTEHGWPGVEEDDEVLATPLTCTATNWPIISNNMKIKWVDIDPSNLNMDLDDLARKITRKTKIIMFVHWGGYPLDLDKLKSIQDHAERLYGFRPAVIEDCAHSLGAEYKGRKIGNHGNICSFSLQAIKHINSIDGGILVLPHKKLYDRGKLLRWYGIDRDTNKKDFRCETNVPEIGFKFHMNDVNATVGRENFNHINDILESHRDNANYYNNELKDVEGITLLENKPDRKGSYWIYSMLVERRDDFMDLMKECDIMVSQVHERNDIHSCVKKYRTILPNTDKVVSKLICIPNGWWIHKEEREYIVESIKKGW